MSDPPEAAVVAAMHAGRAYTGDSDFELAKAMLRAALPLLGTTSAKDLTGGQFDRAWAPVTPGARRFRPTGFGLPPPTSEIPPQAGIG